MPKYNLVLRIEFDAMDDVQAREKARELIPNVALLDEDQNLSIKLQSIEQGKEPKGVRL